MKNINCKGRLVSLDEPKIMGILNLTPDSFYDGGKYKSQKKILTHIENMIQDGMDILDIGGMSSRPGAHIISIDEELKRIIPHIVEISTKFPHLVLSVDTIQSRVAQKAIEAGAHIINDISAGDYDSNMIDVVARLQVPYIIMHMKGLPHTMQEAPYYDDVVIDIMHYFSKKLDILNKKGICDVVIDVGFGFGKTIAHNYRLLKQLQHFSLLNTPILAGISRKSMLCKPLNIKPSEALNASIFAHTICLNKGVSILRVHDVKEAKQTLKLFSILEKA